MTPEIKVKNVVMNLFTTNRNENDYPQIMSNSVEFLHKDYLVRAYVKTPHDKFLDFSLNADGARESINLISKELVTIDDLLPVMEDIFEKLKTNRTLSYQRGKSFRVYDHGPSFNGQGGHTIFTRFLHFKYANVTKDAKEHDVITAAKKAASYIFQKEDHLPYVVDETLRKAVERAKDIYTLSLEHSILQIQK